MELSWYFVVVPLLVLIFFPEKWFFTTQPKLTPPSPRKLPIIGNLHQLGWHPHRSLHKLSQKYGPVMLLHLGSKPAVVSSSVDTARDIMKTHDLVCSNRLKSSIADGLIYGSKDMAFSPYGEYWRQIRNSFIAGTDTTNTTLEWIMAEVLRHPRVMEKLQNGVRGLAQGKAEVTEDDLGNMHYLKAVIKETLRLHPPFPLLIRESMEDVILQDYHIPAKTQVLINAWAIGRDPLSWDDPEEYRPERFLNSDIDFRGPNFEFIPFGTGRRGCPGITFAIAIIELTLARLVHNFNFALSKGLKEEDLDMSECTGLTARKKLPLLAVATPWSS